MQLNTEKIYNKKKIRCPSVIHFNALYTQEAERLCESVFLNNFECHLNFPENQFRKVSATHFAFLSSLLGLPNIFISESIIQSLQIDVQLAQKIVHCVKLLSGKFFMYRLICIWSPLFCPSYNTYRRQFLANSRWVFFGLLRFFDMSLDTPVA